VQRAHKGNRAPRKRRGSPLLVLTLIAVAVVAAGAAAAADVGIPQSVSVAVRSVVVGPVESGASESVGVSDSSSVVGPAESWATESVGVSDSSSAVGPAESVATAPVSVSDSLLVVGPAEPAAAESVGVSDSSSVMGPAESGAAESVGVRDSMLVVGPAEPAATESVGVSDSSSVMGPAESGAAESVGVRDSTLVVGPAEPAATESVGVSDSSSVVGPAKSEATESVGVTDVTLVAGPAQPSAAESVGVRDSALVVGPAEPGSTESVGVTDTAVVLPPAVIAVDERVAAQDVPSVAGPAVVTAGEAVHAADASHAIPPAVVGSGETVHATDGAAALGPVQVGSDENAHASDAAGAQIVNTAPTVDAGADGTAAEGSTFTGSGSFADPDQQTWTATADYGDGSGVLPLTLDPDKTFQLSHVYDDNGTYTVTVRVVDSADAAATDTTTATVTNAAPTASVGNSGPIDEGTSATIAFSDASDPSSADTNAGFHYAFACDGGDLGAATYATAGVSASTSCPFPDSGTHAVRGRIVDKDDGFTEATTDVAVRNLPPTATLSNSGPAAEMSPVTISFSSASDPSPSDLASLHYAFACDGSSLSGVTYATSEPAAVTTCAFPDNGTYIVSGRVIDQDGGFTDYTTTVAVTNTSPTATLAVPPSAQEGTPITVALNDATDLSPVDLAAGFHYAFSCDGPTLDATTYATSGTESSTSCVYDDGASEHTVYARVIDKDGGHTEYSAAVHVDNVAPSGSLVTPSTAVAEGSSFSISVTNVSDPSAADTAVGFSYRFDCGAGYGSATPTPSTTCAAIDNPDQGVSARIIDKDGGATELTARVTVTNVPPSLTLDAPVSGAMYPVGETVTVNGAFTDPGVRDTHTCTVGWGNGSTSAGSVTESGGNGTCFAAQSFSAAGVYSIASTVTDKDGASDTKSVLVVVYDTTGGGWISGNGWILSPPGAYTANPSLTGRASFGFLSKYKAGATTPTGTTAFQFGLAAFAFSATSYDWLVVSGAKAQYKGVGTVNGAAGYSFLLTATDGDVLRAGQPDRFRIKVWVTASGLIVYDNVPGASDDISVTPQAIAGGSIVIHK